MATHAATMAMQKENMSNEDADEREKERLSMEIIKSVEIAARDAL